MAIEEDDARIPCTKGRPTRCGYLPEQRSTYLYRLMDTLTAEEYEPYLRSGWRRFGSTLFRPYCESCRECRSLRIPVTRFRPDRSQRRAWSRNEGNVELEIRDVRSTSEKMALFRRYHAHQQVTRGWLENWDSEDSYDGAINDSTLPCEEWNYRLDGKLVGLGFVDAVPGALSAIYFVHDPEHRDRGLGTWNVLRLIAEARLRGLEYLYLGYYVPACPSLSYKARFRPHELLDRRREEWFEPDQTGI